MGARGLGPPEGGMARGRFAGKPGEELAGTPQTKEHAYSYTDEPSPTRPATVEWHGRHFSLPYFYRDGTDGPAILFVHGLGGAKENFYAAFQSPALADCTLATFDEPGTGLAAFDPSAGLDVSALADMAQAVADQLLPGPYFLAGAS